MQPLFDGPFDIMGDVHGAIEALRLLMGPLGYFEKGRNAECRRLIFPGDLTGPAPDSPAVVEWVGELIESGQA